MPERTADDRELQADVGGLAEQAGPNDVLFRTDDELVEILMAKVEAAR